MDPRRVAPDSAWWTKTARARVHIDECRRVVAAIRVLDAYEVMKVPGTTPNTRRYVWRDKHAIPAVLAAIVGDVVHNLRSALDCLAYQFDVVLRGRRSTFFENRPEGA